MTTAVKLSETASRLLPELDALPETDRLGLAQYLYETLDESDDASEEEIRSAWKVELLARLDDIQSGKVTPEPIEEMFRRSREKHP